MLARIGLKAVHAVPHGRHDLIGFEAKTSLINYGEETPVRRQTMAAEHGARMERGQRVEPFQHQTEQEIIARWFGHPARRSRETQRRHHPALAVTPVVSQDLVMIEGQLRGQTIEGE